MNRGSQGEIIAGHGDGLRFNEAPIHESGKFRRIDEEDGRFDASMRPRFMNRGSHKHRFLLETGCLASMRPRFMNRGSPGDRASTSLSVRSLQ